MIFAVHNFLEIILPISKMMLVVLCLVFVSVISFFSYKKKNNISDKRLFFELLFDVMAFSAQIYLSGGISNPFIFLFLLQVIIATILLKRIYAVAIFIITVLCYLWLSKNYQELLAFNHHSHEFFNLHLYGMLFSYVIAGILLLIFITKIIKNLQQKESQIIAQEQIIRMGLLASGAAHRLGSPLTTIAVLLNDLKYENSKENFNSSTKTIEGALLECKKIISNINSFYGKARAEEARKINAKEAFEQLIKKWQDSKMAQNLIYNFLGDDKKEIIIDDILMQSLFDVLDNAFEASSDFIKVDVEVKNNMYSISVQDKGAGFSKEILENLGKPNLTTKNSSGIGLFLAISGIARIGGKIEVKNLEIGALVKIIVNYE